MQIYILVYKRFIVRQTFNSKTDVDFLSEVETFTKNWNKSHLVQPSGARRKLLSEFHICPNPASWFHHRIRQAICQAKSKAHLMKKSGGLHASQIIFFYEKARVNFPKIREKENSSDDNLRR